MYQNNSNAFGCPLFKAVVFLHGLVVQVLSVNDKQHLIDIRQRRGNTGGLKRRERFAGTGCMPNVSASGDISILFVVVRDFDAIDYPLGRCNLIWTHDHQHILRSENAVLRQNVQQRMPGLCKVN